MADPRKIAAKKKPNVSYLFNPSQYLASGMVRPGNIDLVKRPAVRNKDGSVSSVRSATFTQGKRAILIPTVIKRKDGSGYVASAREAWRHYQKTGRHLGIFKTERQANNYAEQLHRDQARRYS